MPVYTLLKAIEQHLFQHKPGFNGINSVLENLRSIERQPTPSNAPTNPPQHTIPTPLKVHLDNALQAMQDHPNLALLADALKNAYHHLNWQIDDGLYYDQNADIGHEYKTGNMHCEIVGPGECFFRSDHFRLGLFLLKPNVLYRDHYHKAPEFYLNLTGPNRWRFNHGPWRDYQAGSMLWNDCNEIHATQVGQVPFLSVYSWTSDINGLCHVSCKKTAI